MDGTVKVPSRTSFPTMEQPEPIAQPGSQAPADDDVLIDEDMIASALSSLAVTKKKAKGKRTSCTCPCGLRCCLLSLPCTLSRMRATLLQH